MEFFFGIVEIVVFFVIAYFFVQNARDRLRAAEDANMLRRETNAILKEIAAKLDK